MTNYNPFLVYCRELAPRTVSLTRGQAQGDDSKHDSHYTDVTGAAFHQFVAIENGLENYPVGCVQTVSEEFLMAMDGILFCAYMLIFMVTSLTIFNRYSFNILMNVNK